MNPFDILVHRVAHLYASDRVIQGANAGALTYKIMRLFYERTPTFPPEKLVDFLKFPLPNLAIIMGLDILLLDKIFPQDTKTARIAKFVITETAAVAVSSYCGVPLLKSMFLSASYRAIKLGINKACDFYLRMNPPQPA